MHTKKIHTIKLFGVLLFVLLLIGIVTISANAVTTDGSGTASSSTSTSSQAPIGSVKIYVKKDNVNWTSYGTRVFLRSTTNENVYFELLKAGSSKNYSVSNQSIPIGTYDVVVHKNGSASQFGDTINEPDYQKASGVKINVTSNGGSATINYYTISLKIPFAYGNAQIISPDVNLCFGLTSINPARSISSTVLKNSKFNQIAVTNIKAGYMLSKTVYKEMNTAKTYSSSAVNWKYSFPAITQPVEIKVDFTKATYTATFNTNGGIWSDKTTANKSIKFTISTELKAPATVSREGYTFMYWSAQRSGTGNCYSSSETVDQPYLYNKQSGYYGNVTFTAVWVKNTYKIKYDLYGITVKDINKSALDVHKHGLDENNTSRPHTYFRDAAFPSGYDKTYTSGNYKYHMNPTTATVTATGAPIDGYNKYFYLENPTMTGYKFVGWVVYVGNSLGRFYPSIFVNGKDLYFERDTKIETLQNKTNYFSNLSYNDKTAYFIACWQPIEYTITLNLNGGYYRTSDSSTSSAPTKQLKLTYTLEKATLSPLLDCNPRIRPDYCLKNGYSFAGWQATSVSGNWKLKTYDKYLSPLENDPEREEPYSKRLRYGDATFSAVWTPRSFVATFNTGGGKWADATTANKMKSYNITNTLTVPSTVSRVGYTFAGWKVTVANGSALNHNWVLNTVYKNSPQTKLAGATGKYGNVTFTAQWRATYTIKYNLNGGTFANGTNKTYTSGSLKYYRNPTSQKFMGAADTGYSKYFRVDTPTKAGYKFNGWTVTGMNSNTHYIWVNNKSNTSTATSFANTSTFGKATLFYNLRNTPGTVTFTANWVPVK